MKKAHSTNRRTGFFAAPRPWLVSKIIQLVSYLCIMNLIQDNIDNIRVLCMKYNVGRLFVFGSALGSSFKPESDIDLLVSFKDIRIEDYADNYFDFKFSLEDLFKREIDLLEEQAIKNPFLLKSINSTKKLVYES
jgi:uncharacterized protein